MMGRKLFVVALVCLVAMLSMGADAQSVTRGTFKVIAEVQKLMEAERFSEAIAELEVLVEETKSTPYDHAIANQFLAHNSVMLDNVPRARRALKAALSMPDLPLELSSELKLFYGSVLMGDEEYELGRQMLEDWLAVAERPKSHQLFSVGYANYMTGNLPRAEELITRALEKAGSKAQDSWYQAHYQVLFEQRKYKQAESQLYFLIARNSSKELHWRMLVSHYLQLEKNEDALAATMASYFLGLVEREEDFKRIVSLYSFVDVPDKAARLLEGWMADGKIKTDADTVKQLGNLWLLARERAKAKEVLTRAARMAPDGKTYEMLGGIYFEDEEWNDAYRSFRQALQSGGVDEPSRLSLLAGISAFRAGLMDEATVDLERARQSGKYRKQADGLLNQIK
jgi:tetratricopeptide (TPR) repeat protein